MNSLVRSSAPLKMFKPYFQASDLFKTSVQGFHRTSPAMDVKGQIAQKTPTKVLCEEGKTYVWCACGLSDKQPFCNGAHKRSSLGLTPVRWTASATKEYYFCNCKQTNKRPFCDGSHKKL